MRLLFYITAFAVYILSFTIAAISEDLSELQSSLERLWFIAFTLIATDFVFRLRASLFLILPLFYALFIPVQLFKLGELSLAGLEIKLIHFFAYSEFVIYIIAGILLLFQALKIKAKDIYTFRMFTAISIILILIGANLLILIPAFEFLSVIYKFNILYYLLAAICGHFLTSRKASIYKQKETSLISFIFIISLVFVISGFFQNFFPAATN